MKRTKPTETPRARLPERLDPASLSLSDGETVRLVACEGDELPGSIATGVKLDQVSLSRVNLSESRLDSLEGLDVRLTECDLSGVSLSEANLVRVEFHKCRMTGCHANGAQLEAASFCSCKMDWSAVRYGELSKCVFHACDLRNADFEGSALRNVKFHECNLSFASFQRCKLDHVDFRGSELVDIQGADRLRGATIDSVQLVVLASSMAQALGVTVLDEGTDG